MTEEAIQYFHRTQLVVGRKYRTGSHEQLLVDIQEHSHFETTGVLIPIPTNDDYLAIPVMSTVVHVVIFVLLMVLCRNQKGSNVTNNACSLCRVLPCEIHLGDPQAIGEKGWIVL